MTDRSVSLCVHSGVQGVHQISWLTCRFTDEKVVLNKSRHVETHFIPRQVMLQFGEKGDPPINPDGITFLLTASKLDLRRYVEGVEPEELECELRRYSTEGIHVRWPVQGALGFNRWFSCTLKHSKGLFMVTGVLRHPSDQGPPGQQDYRSWPAISDRELLPMTVAMVIKTQTPVVNARLRSEQKLHCKFAFDHRGPKVTVEWHRQHRGERSRLFSHDSRSGQTHGSGVALKGLARGVASYTLPFTKTISEGTYICSVSVVPLFASLDISLHIEEPPRVSLNVGPTLVMEEGKEQKIMCEAESYYPLDVDIAWYEQDLQASLENVLMSSHKHNADSTFSLAAFFYLQASLNASGRQFTCSVTHQSLRVPIRQSFILEVEEPSSWMLKLTLGFLVFILLAVLARLNSARRHSVQKKPD
ncbi:tapasin-related protein-like [Cololabis saira]|uniref:tapasin-related protein-like n=1 Tax=Cololabis saira TaxID=129043 RepID=UPI002AD25328|nr:tapasin-related protein-like [Cololabis saira]